MFEFVLVGAEAGLGVSVGASVGASDRTYRVGLSAKSHFGSTKLRIGVSASIPR